MNTTKKFKLLHIVDHLVCITAIINIVHESAYWWFFLGFICFLWTGIVGVNIGLHRYYAHRSFKTSYFKEQIILWTSVFTGLGSPLMWGSLHRMHHAYSDTDKDPHNPRTNGIIKTWFTIWGKLHIPKRFVVSFLKNPEIKFVHRHYFFLNFLFLLLLISIFGLNAAAMVYCLPAVGCFHGAAAIGVIPHYFGYKTYQTRDESRNSWIASILSLGEGWHNNHHANPGRWYQGEKWWEIDPAAFLIKHFFKT